MAKTAAKAGAFAHLDDETQYQVQLKSAFQHAGVWFRPCDRIALKGKVIKAKAENIHVVHPLAS